MLDRPREKKAKLYRCEECGHKAFFHWVEIIRATRARCPNCGSARLAVFYNPNKVRKKKKGRRH